MAQAGTADPLRRTGGTQLLPFDENIQRFGPLLHQSIADPATEAAAIGHQVQSFEQAGLARTVGACNQVDPRAWRQFHRIETADSIQGDTDDMH